MSNLQTIAGPFTGLAKKFLSGGRKAVDLVGAAKTVAINKGLMSQGNSYKATPTTPLNKVTVGKTKGTSGLPFAAGIGMNQNGCSALSCLVAFNRSLLSGVITKDETEVISKVLKIQEPALKDGCSNTEDFADNKDSDLPMPPQYYPLFRNTEEAVVEQGNIGIVPDTLNLYGVKALIGSDTDDEWPLSFTIGYGADYAAKRPILSLGEDEYNEVIHALGNIDVKVRSTGIREAIGKAVDAFPDVYLKGQVEAAALFHNDYVNWVNDYFSELEEDTKVADAAQEELDVLEENCSKEWGIYEYVVKERSRVGAMFDGFDQMDDIAKQVILDEQTRSRQNVVKRLNELCQIELETLVLISMLHGVTKLWIFEYQHEIFRMATQLLEATDIAATVAEFEANGVKPESINKALEVRVTGKFTTVVEKNGKTFTINGKPKDLFNILDVVGIFLAGIPSQKKVGDNKYQDIPENLVHELPALDAWNNAMIGALMLDDTREDVRKTEFFRINKSVNNGEVDADGNVVWPAGFDKGTGVSTAHLGPNESNSVDDSVQFEVKPYKADPKKTKEENAASADMHQQKVGKRLGMFGTYYRYVVNLLPVKIKELVNELQHPAHEGRAWMHPDTCGLKEGIYSSSRGLMPKWGKLKFVLEVTKDCPKGELPMTSGSYKTKELNVLKGSKHLMVGYKHHADSARTSWCWLNSPETFIQAAEWQRVHAYDASVEAVRRADKRLRGSLPSAGLASKVTEQGIGNAKNLTKGKFKLYDIDGCVKSYVRGAVSFDKDLEEVLTFKLGGDVCIVSPKAYEIIADICGGADSDDVYYVRKVEGGWEFRRDPNVGVETAFLCELTGEVK